jgi:hypothetical protein
MTTIKQRNFQLASLVSLTGSTTAAISERSEKRPSSPAGIFCRGLSFVLQP